MKKLFLLFILVGCSSGVINKDNSQSPTSILTTIPDYPFSAEDIVFTPIESAFFDDAGYYYSVNYTPEQKLEILETGYLLCQLMDNGMTGTDIVERINEAGTDLHQRRIYFSVAIAAIATLCRTHFDEVEYISLNFPL